MQVFTRTISSYLTAIVIVFITLMSCSHPTPVPTLTPQPTPVIPDPKDLIKQTSVVMRQLEHFHFRLHHEKGSLELAPNLLIDEVEGDLSRPDRMSINFSGSLGELAVQTKLLTIGESTFITNPLTGKWESGPTGVNALGFFSPQTGISAILSQLDLSTFEGSVEISGETYTLSGQLPVEALSSLVGETLTKLTVTVELIIDMDSHHLLLARLDGQVTPTDTGEVVRVVTLSNFNSPVDIERPF